MTSLMTPRLQIRVPNTSDFEALYAIHADPRANRFNPGWIETKREDFWNYFHDLIDHHNSYGFGYYSLVIKENNQVLGLCGLKHTQLKGQPFLNLYYRIDSNQTQRGYVKEAAVTIIEYVLELTQSQIPLMVLTLNTNLPSRRTAEALGFVYDKSWDDYQGFGNVYYFMNRP